MIQIPIELNGGILPTRGSRYAAAYDVYCPQDFELTKQRNIVPLGFCIGLPLDWKANIRPRSGFSAKGFEVEIRTTYRRYSGETYTTAEKARIDADVLIGLVDGDYRDEVGVMVKCYSLAYIAKQKYEFDTIVENHIIIPKGTRFAQMEICGNGESYELVQVDGIDRDVDRGGGFGHTGTR